MSSGSRSLDGRPRRWLVRPETRGPIWDHMVSSEDRASSELVMNGDHHSWEAESIPGGRQGFIQCNSVVLFGIRNQTTGSAYCPTSNGCKPHSVTNVSERPSYEEPSSERPSYPGTGVRWNCTIMSLTSGSAWFSQAVPVSNARV